MSSIKTDPHVEEVSYCNFAAFLHSAPAQCQFMAF
jgi:hypothetical protein